MAEARPSGRVLAGGLLGVLVLLFILLWWGWSRYGEFLEQALALPEGGQVVQVEPGATGQAIVRQLAAMGLTREAWEWRLLMRLQPRVYRAGEYRLEPGMTPPQVLDKLASGDVVHYRFTVVEGWTFRQLAAALAANEVLRHELAFGEAEGRARLTQELSLEHLEGWFLPETYAFTRGDSDREILQRAHTAMKTALDEAWSARQIGLPLADPYELLTLASIIEKETARDEERGRIAGVFARRLSRGMRLQTDPTVIYGLGESFDGDIRRRDLQTDTPYNTYTRHGLPPTPIAMPGRASLMAAAQPEDGDALYFVADGEGGHTFSTTLEEHRKAVQKLIGKG
jgi:UPF0755 protein